MAFIYGELNNELIYENGIVKLKEYEDDLLFYASFDNTINANYAESNIIPSYYGSYELRSSGAFGQAALMSNSYIKYSEENFSGINEFTASFWIKPNFSTGKGYQEFLATAPSGITNTTYYFYITVDTVKYLVDVLLTSADQMLDIIGKINTRLTAMLIEATASLSSSGKIRITAKTFGSTVLLENYSSNNISVILGGIDKPYLFNFPSVDTKLFDSFNAINNNNRITITHKNSKDIEISLYDGTGSIVSSYSAPWSNDTRKYNNFELCINDTIAQFFIDGKLFALMNTGFTPKLNNVYIGSINGSDGYFFDELIVSSVYKHQKNFTPNQYALTRYSVNSPYVDFKIENALDLGDIQSLLIDCSNSVSFNVSIGNQTYYYYNSAWMPSDGTFSKSSEKTIFLEKFPTLFFNGQDVIIRAFLTSDGNTEVYIGEINVIIDKFSEKPAKIIGTKSINTPIDLTNDYFIKIQTSSGERTIDFRSAPNIAAVTLQDIKNIINNSNVANLAPVSSDGNNKLVLFTRDVGDSAIISILGTETNSALSLIWGEATASFGTEEAGQFSFDYTEIFRYIRSMLGHPITIVELTEEHLYDAVSYAVYYFNYYRNSKENMLKVKLTMNLDGSYNLPKEIAGQDDIIDILFRPSYPFSFFGGTNNDIMSQSYINWFFQNNKNGGFSSMASDYYVSLSTINDISNILGTKIGYRFFGEKLFITPNQGPGLDVAIVFKSAATVQEINTNMLIKKLALAKAKQILGEIRSSFGGTIPGGTENIQLKSSEFVTQGKEDEQEALQELQRLQEPLFIMFV